VPRSRIKRPDGLRVSTLCAETPFESCAGHFRLLLNFLTESRVDDIDKFV
jgi:hypothetical protein